MGSRWDALIVDALDPERLGRWWAEVLDHRVESVSAAGGRGRPRRRRPSAADLPAPPGRQARQEPLHLDLRPDDLDGEIERLVNMGARHVDVGQPEDATWFVLADPEGNEFCILRTSGMTGGDGLRQGVPLAVATGLGLLTVAAGAFALYNVRQILVQVVIAVFVAVSLDPAVRLLIRRGVRRSVAVAVIVVLALLSSPGSSGRWCRRWSGRAATCCATSRNTCRSCPNGPGPTARWPTATG